MRKISIAAARVDAGLTRGQMAKKLGIAAVTYAKCEEGEIRLRQSRLETIAEITGFDVEELRLPNEPRETTCANI